MHQQIFMPGQERLFLLQVGLTFKRNTQCDIHFSHVVQKNTSQLISIQNCILFLPPAIKRILRLSIEYALPTFYGSSAYSSATPKCQLSQVKSNTTLDSKFFFFEFFAARADQIPVFLTYTLTLDPIGSEVR